MVGGQNAGMTRCLTPLLTATLSVSPLTTTFSLFPLTTTLSLPHLTTTLLTTPLSTPLSLLPSLYHPLIPGIIHQPLSHCHASTLPH